MSAAKVSAQTISSPGGDVRNRMLGRVLVLLGVAAIVLSLAWWAVYYNEVIRALGQNPPLTHPLRCLLWTSDVCVQAKATAKLSFPAYHPLAMWLSFVVLVLGLVVVFRSTSPGPYPLTPRRRAQAVHPEARAVLCLDPRHGVAAGPRRGGRNLAGARHGQGAQSGCHGVRGAQHGRPWTRTGGAIRLHDLFQRDGRRGLHHARPVHPLCRSLDLRFSSFSSRSWRTSATAMAGPIRAAGGNFR